MKLYLAGNTLQTTDLITTTSFKKFRFIMSTNEPKKPRMSYVREIVQNKALVTLFVVAALDQ